MSPDAATLAFFVRTRLPSGVASWLYFDVERFSSHTPRIGFDCAYTPMT